jgi:hypothetical protein
MPTSSIYLLILDGIDHSENEGTEWVHRISEANWDVSRPFCVSCVFVIIWCKKVRLQQLPMCELIWVPAGNQKQQQQHNYIIRWYILC